MFGAYYDESGGSVRTGDISHFRQPYKDYTSLSATEGMMLGYDSVLMGHLWYVNPDVQSTLKAMVAYPIDSQPDVLAFGDKSMVEFGTSLPVGNLPTPSAWDMVLAFVAKGYAALLTWIPANKVLLIAFTTSPGTVALLAGVRRSSGSIAPSPSPILLMPPGIGLQSEAIATGLAPVLPTDVLPVHTSVDMTPGATPSGNVVDVQPRKTDLLSSVGPLGVTMVVLGVVCVGALLLDHHNKRRRT